MLELKNKGQINGQMIAKVGSFPVFATPDDICGTPFLFSRKLRLKVNFFSVLKGSVIECAVQTVTPVEDPLLSKFGGKGAFDRYSDWWATWHRQQEDNMYLGSEAQDIKLLLYHLESILGRRFIEPDYPLTQ